MKVRRAVSAGALAVVALAIAACGSSSSSSASGGSSGGSSSGSSGGANAITIYSDLPLKGAVSAQTMPPGVLP